MKINFGKINNEVTEFDSSLVSLNFNTSLTEAQERSGVVAKVTVIHPAFTTRATIFEKNGNFNVQGASKLLDDENWFNIVFLTQSFREYIVAEFENFKENSANVEPWYLNRIGKREYEVVDNDVVNPTLDITNIIYTTKLSDNQKKAGIVAKASIQTSIGTVRSLTIFKSKFGNSLYSRAQTEDEDDEIPAYALSKDCEAQVLAVLHNGIEDWTIEAKDPVAEAVANAVKDQEVAVTEEKPKAKKKGRKASTKDASKVFKD